jgi:hypothetical protein
VGHRAIVLSWRQTAQARYCEAGRAQNIDRYLTVPSLRGRQGTHPFSQMVIDTGLIDAAAPRLVAAPAAKSDDRRVSGHQFLMAPGDVDMTGEHVAGCWRRDLTGGDPGAADVGVLIGRDRRGRPSRRRLRFARTPIQMRRAARCAAG